MMSVDTATDALLTEIRRVIGIACADASEWHLGNCSPAIDALIAAVRSESQIELAELAAYRALINTDGSERASGPDRMRVSLEALQELRAAYFKAYDER